MKRTLVPALGVAGYLPNDDPFRAVREVRWISPESSVSVAVTPTIDERREVLNVQVEVGAVDDEVAVLQRYVIDDPRRLDRAVQHISREVARLAGAI